MNIREVKYYFGRVNILANYKDKKDYLLTGFKTEKFIERRNFLWGFFDISEFESSLGSIIFGSLVKYSPIRQEKVAEPETHKLIDEPIENKVLGNSRFFLHINSGLIAYHPKSGIITRKQFSEIFKELFEEAYEKIFVNIEIQSIDEQYQIFKAIESFQVINKVQIYLHPSNPSNRSLWKSVDEKFKKLEVGSYSEQFIAHPNSSGLKSVGEDQDISSKIYMSEDGYGETKVSGLMNNEKKVVSTKDNPIRKSAPNDDSEPKEVFDVLKITFSKLLERFSK